MARTNSTGASGGGGDVVRDDGAGLASGHRTAVLVVALVASAACYTLVPGDTLAGSLAQTALLAAVALGAVGLAHPHALGAFRRGTLAGMGPWIGYVLLLSLGAGVVAPVVSGGAELAVTISHLVQVGALCLLTGVFEEGVFRVLAIDSLSSAFGGGRRGLLAAAFVSSVLFGALHVSLGDTGAAATGVAIGQAMFKPLQAGLFGFFMAALYVRSGNLWLLAVVHGAFNLLYIGSGLLLAAPGIPQTYVTGDPFDLVLLVATTALLVPAAVAAFNRLRAE